MGVTVNPLTTTIAARAASQTNCTTNQIHCQLTEYQSRSENKESIQTEKDNRGMQQVEELLGRGVSATQPGQTQGPSSGLSGMLSGGGGGGGSSGLSGSQTSPLQQIFGGSQAAQTATASGSSQNMNVRLQNILNLIQQIARNLFENIRAYTNQYPPLAAFLFTLLALSIVPVTVFLLFAGGTLAVTLSTALIGFGLVEGFLLMIGGAFLALALGGIAICTGVGFAWLFGIWIAYRGAYFLYQRVSGTAGSLSDTVTGSIRHMGQQARDVMSSAMSGTTANPTSASPQYSAAPQQAQSSQQQQQPTSSFFGSSQPLQQPPQQQQGTSSFLSSGQR
jgi:Promethin